MLGLRSSLIMAGVIIVLVLLAVTLGPAACNRIRSQGAQNRLNQGETEALANSAHDAVETQGKANRRETESEALTRSNEKEIRDAEGANDAVNPGVNAAGLRSLCRRSAYRDSQRCKLLNAPAK